MNASEALVSVISQAGIKHAFGLPGNSLRSSAEYMFRSGEMRFITVRHEQVAAGMAEGYARVTGRPGVCIAGAGPSAANLLIGVANAYRASSPMLVLTGNVARSRLGRDSLNEWDQMAMFEPISKLNIQVTDPRNLLSHVKSALLSSVSGRPGPVHVDIPTDVGTAEVAAPRPDSMELAPTRLEARLEQVEAAMNLLLSAERPVVIAGGGTLASCAGDRLRKVSELLSVPVAVSGARGILPEDHPLCFGPVGVWGYSTCNELVKSSDFVMGLGFRFADDTTMGWTIVPSDAKIVQVDIDPREIGRQYDVDVGIVADIDTFLKSLLKLIRARAKKGSQGWPRGRLKAMQLALRKERERFLEGPFEDAPVDKRIIIRDVMRMMREDAIITAGTGIHTRYASRLTVRRPRCFHRSGSFAAMGFAFPAALGAKAASPDSQVLCLDGDGDFMMTVQDMETAVREDLPLVTVVFNNLSYGAYKPPNSRGRRVGVEFENPDFVKLAESFGAVGARVTRSKDFGPALKELVESDRPAVLDAVVTSETNLPWY